MKSPLLLWVATLLCIVGWAIADDEAAYARGGLCDPAAVRDQHCVRGPDSSGIRCAALFGGPMDRVWRNPIRLPVAPLDFLPAQPPDLLFTAEPEVLAAQGCRWTHLSMRYTTGNETIAVAGPVSILAAWSPRASSAALPRDAGSVVAAPLWFSASVAPVHAVSTRWFELVSWLLIGVLGAAGTAHVFFVYLLRPWLGWKL